MTSTSAYLAACAEATQPFIRTVFFFVEITVVAIVHSHYPPEGEATINKYAETLISCTMSDPAWLNCHPKSPSPADSLDSAALVPAGRLPRFSSSCACRPCSPGEIANAVSMRTTPVSKSSSGTPSRHPVGHSSIHTRQPLQ